VFGGIFGYKTFTGKMMAKYMFSGKAPAITVSTAKVGSLSWQAKIKSIGSLKAVSGSDLAAEVGGLVETVDFNSGEDAKAGQVLARLNAKPELAQLRSLKILVELARTVYQRDQKQFEVKAISQAVLDADAADLSNKQAQLEQQKAVIAKKIIKAPFDGKLGISMVNPGQYLNPGDKIVTLQSLDSVYVDFYLPQQDVSRISLGQPVEVSIDAYPDKIFSGKITAISSKVDMDTRNILVEALIDNSKHQLLPGMYASVEVLSGKPQNYLTVPQTAITFNPYGETVFLVQSKEGGEAEKSAMTVKEKFVVVGEARGDQIAVLSGLNEGDTVVTSGQIKLKNGSGIIVNNKVQPSNDAAPEPMDE
jgi:membrane fusion protein (multidrug efflux system)